MNQVFGGDFKDYKYDPMPAVPETLYFGTTRGRLGIVMAEGVENPVLSDSADIARVMAEAEASVFQSEDPVVIAISGISADRLLPDDRGLKQPWDLRDTEKLGFMRRVRRSFTWADSLETVGTVRVSGIVRPQEMRVMAGAEFGRLVTAMFKPPVASAWLVVARVRGDRCT